MSIHVCWIFIIFLRYHSTSTQSSQSLSRSHSLSLAPFARILFGSLTMHVVYIYLSVNELKFSTAWKIMHINYKHGEQQ